MKRSIYAILLAGRLRPSPLVELLETPVICLPVGRRGSLLDAWMDVLHKLPALEQVQVVVNTVSEVQAVEAMAGIGSAYEALDDSVHVIAEPAPWRGAAGIVRDVATDLPDDALVLICEAKRLPPCTLEPMLDIPFDGEGAVSGMVGICGSDMPLGVYIFNRNALNIIPEIGYFDLKEQLLPALRRAGQRVGAVRIGQGVWRLNDLDSYLECVRQSFALSDSGGECHTRIAASACVAPTASLVGHCIVEPGAVIADGAVIHDSVVLWGAMVGESALVTRSVVGSLATVEPHAQVNHTIYHRRIHAGAVASVDHDWHSAGGRGGHPGIAAKLQRARFKW